MMGVVGASAEAAKKSRAEARRRGEAEGSDHGWPLVRLGDVCEVRTGDSAPQGEKLYTGGTVPFVRTSDVGTIHFGSLWETRDRLTEAAAEKLRRFKAGSILFPKSGASTFLNHRVLLEIEACVASHLAVITPSAAVDSHYLLYVLSQVDAKALMQDSGYPALRSSEIEAISFPLPSLSTQRAIVARLDSALARAGQLEKDFANLAAQADAEFKAALNEEFAKIEAQEAKKKSRAETRRRGEDEETGHGWPLVRLGEVCDFRRGLTYSKSDETEYSDNAVLRSNNIDLASNALNLAELRYIKSGVEIPNEKRVTKWSVLICMANGSKEHLGKVAFIDREYSYAFGGFMGLLLPHGIDPRYLYHCLCTPQFRTWITNLTDGTNINNLKFSDLSEFTIPLPPLSVQREIVARLDAAMARCEAVAALARRAAEACATLSKALLKEAFE